MKEDKSGLQKRSSQASGLNDPLLQISFDDPAKKADYSFGQKIAKQIYKEQSNESVPYFYAGRNLRWRENRLWAKGMQDMNEFKDYMHISGVQSWVNLDWTATKLGAKFVRVLISSMMKNEEYPRVKAVDDGSIGEKADEKQNALFRMHDVENITDMQQQAGMSFEPPNAYVPDSEEAADVYFAEEFKLQDEAEMEEYLVKVLGASGAEQLKRRLLKDGVEVNTLVTKLEVDDDGQEYIEVCTPETVIFNYFYNETGRLQLSYIGRVYSLKVKDLRIKYGHKLSEKEIFDVAKSATQVNVNVRWTWGWNNTYLTTAERPYDDWSVDVFDFEIMTADADYYTSKKDSYGKEDIQLKRGIPQPQSDKVTVMKKAKNTVYRGVWAIRADRMLYWGLPDITLRPFQSTSEALFSYSIHVINNDGEYVPSLFEGGLEPLREYALCKLKRKQLISNLRASGVRIDVERIRDIDLGNGVIEPMEAVRIYNQTGNVLWSSAGLNPNEEGRPPIDEMPNAGSIPQLNELCNIIDRCLEEVRGQLGVPLSRDGSDMPPRMGVGVVENQLNASNNVTDDIYKAYLSILQETLHKVCIRKWDKEAIINGDDSKLSKLYDVEVTMLPTLYEKQILEEQLAIGLKEGFISQSTAAKVRNIKNFKVAHLYLGQQEEKAKQQQQAASSQMQQENARLQQESNEAAAKQKQAEAALQAQIDAAKQEAIGKQAKEQILLTNILTIYSSGLPMPAELQPLAQAVLANVAMPLVAENQQMTQAAMQQAMPPEQGETPQQEMGEPAEQQVPQEEMQPAMA